MLIKDLPFTIDSLKHYYAQGGKPEVVVEELYRRLERVNDPGMFITLHSKEKMIDQAKRLDTNLGSQPLWGIPYAVKDNIDCYDAPTTAGCPNYAYIPEQDAFVVKKLRQQGALGIGKTNLDQFATGLVGVRSPYIPPTNAFDPILVPGGSSSGSSVVVAHGIVSFALGTDTVGSGRVPAAMNNIVGLKPTRGSMSVSGLTPACKTLDTVSIFALTVSDATLVYESLNQFDPSDSYSRVTPRAGRRTSIDRLRVATPDDDSLVFFDDDHLRAHVNALSLIKKNRVELATFDFRPFTNIENYYSNCVWVAERYAAVRDLVAKQPNSLHPTTRHVFQDATKLSAVDAVDSMCRLEGLQREVEPVLSNIDIMILPTIPTMLTLEEVDDDPIDANNRLGVYTNFVNLLDLCALTVPFGYRDDGLPYSLTLVGKHGDDGLLAGFAQHLGSLCSNKMGATLWEEDRKETPFDYCLSHNQTLQVMPNSQHKKELA